MIPSLVRTYVPLLVALVASGLASLGITIDDATQAGLVAAIGTIIAGLYYAAARVLEKRWPALSVMLGSTQQPVVYTAPNKPAA